MLPRTEAHWDGHFGARRLALGLGLHRAYPARNRAVSHSRLVGLRLALPDFKALSEKLVWSLSVKATGRS